MEQKPPQIALEILRKKKKVGGITIPDITLYSKASVIRTACYWHKNRHIDQWNRIESPEINLCLYGQFIFDKGGKSIQWSKNSVFNKWYWENWIHTGKKNLTYTTYHNKLIVDKKNLSSDTIKIRKKNIGHKFSHYSRSNIFTDISPREREIKEN